MKMPTKIILPLILLFAVSACDGDSDNDISTADLTPPAPAAATTIVDAAVADGNFNTLVAALQATGLDEVLSDTEAKYTVFAPTDAAFALLGEDTINALLADTDTLSDILLYHVLPGEVDATAAIASVGTTVNTANGDAIGLSLDGDMLLVNTVTVTATDIMTDNGIIHVIDAVLLPPADMTEPTDNIVETAIAAGSFTTLVATLQATGLDAVLADEEATFTVFAPTDAAFAMIDEETINTLLANPDVLTSILLQHVVSGAAVNSVNAYALNGAMVETASMAKVELKINSQTDMLTFGGANVVMKDIYTTNGIIHVIDAVIVGAVEIPEPAMSIVDVAIDNGNFTTLVAALQATGLDIVLANLDEDYTVFAPTDAAFAKLPAGTVDALLMDVDALSNILLYHVVPGKVMADGAISVAQSMDNQVATANTNKVALSFVDSMLYVNGAKVTAADVMADNGIIHVVDTVIVPDSMSDMTDMTIAEIVVASASDMDNPEFTTLLAALSAANLANTFADDTATFTVFAPTDAAFAKLPAGTVEGLLMDIPALTDILSLHVVNGAAISSVDAYAANGKMVSTLGGVDISVGIDSDTRMLTVGGAKVIITNIYAKNGVIHVIDTVITN
ncbi:fasciclin domain-containing protein [Colwelliaceae bacterium BS250]